MIPAGCSQKSQLSGHINISHTRIYDFATLPDFPKPAGYYTYKNKKQQQAPYFNIAEVKAFAEKIYGNKVGQPKVFINRAKKFTDENQPYVIPAFSDQERENCRIHRHFINLMRPSIQRAP
jgi:hypothetical protein